MRALLLSVLLGLACGCSRETDSKPDPFAGMDPAVRTVVGATAAALPWINEVRAHVTVHALTPELLSDAASQAEFALSQIQERFGVPASPGLLHLIVAPPELWTALLPGAREKGVAAISFGGTMVVREQGGRIAGLESVCHEAIHAFVAVHLFPRPPLWLEEGLAVHWGAELAADLHRLRGKTVVRREWPPLEKVPDPASLSTYPEDAAGLTVFHAHCGVLVADLEARIGRESLPGFIRSAAREAPRGPVAP